MILFYRKKKEKRTKYIIFIIERRNSILNVRKDESLNSSRVPPNAATTFRLLPVPPPVPQPLFLVSFERALNRLGIYVRVLSTIGTTQRYLS